jgi:adenosylcobinamide-GDP ribazoletransferase
VTSNNLPWRVPPLLAIQFLTRLPVSRWIPTLDNAQLRLGLSRAVGWFPAVGGLVGCIGAGLALIGEAFWPRAVAVVLMLIVEARLTGAFHEDAVADFCDGMGGGQTPERVREIMKDSRIGSYGTLGLLLSVGLRAALLIAMPPVLLAPAIIASAAFGRWIAVLCMALIPPLDQGQSLAKDIGQQTGLGIVAIASLLVLPFVWPLAALAPVHFALALGFSALFVGWFRALLLRQLGGVSGDCLGFTVYAGQLIVPLCALAACPIN